MQYAEQMFSGYPVECRISRQIEHPIVKAVRQDISIIFMISFQDFLYLILRGVRAAIVPFYSDLFQSLITF